MSNLIFLFKIVSRESQFKAIASILVIYQCRGARKNLETENFLQLPLSTTVIRGSSQSWFISILFLVHFPKFCSQVSTFEVKSFEELLLLHH